MCLLSIFLTAPVLTLSPHCQTPSFLSTQVQPGIEKEKKTIKLLPQALATDHLIIKTALFSSLREDEPKLELEKGGVTSSQTSKDRYKIYNFFTHVKAKLARESADLIRQEGVPHQLIFIFSSSDEEGPAPKVSDCIPVTEDLLPLSDRFVTTTIIPFLCFTRMNTVTIF